ncbi:hypothetical protein O181_082967 [Austropuccinia psidii MF-1]|uniref:Uncharacterized protein n=1 Tax=Austropuccinia psidii MF-1 TaxID=1389203 RepID=A0A9Q3IJP5_9BASI|nr:hypothetical protein [Austropuccinia psidii MF-1]
MNTKKSKPIIAVLERKMEMQDNQFRDQIRDGMEYQCKKDQRQEDLCFMESNENKDMKMLELNEVKELKLLKLYFKRESSKKKQVNVKILGIKGDRSYINCKLKLKHDVAQRELDMKKKELEPQQQRIDQEVHTARQAQACTAITDWHNYGMSADEIEKYLKLMLEA